MSSERFDYFWSKKCGIMGIERVKPSKPQEDKKAYDPIDFILTNAWSDDPPIGEDVREITEKAVKGCLLVEQRKEPSCCGVGFAYINGHEEVFVWGIDIANAAKHSQNMDLLLIEEIIHAFGIHHTKEQAEKEGGWYLTLLRLIDDSVFHWFWEPPLVGEVEDFPQAFNNSKDKSGYY